MSSRCLKLCLMLTIITGLIVSGCNREKRQFAPPSAGTITDTQRISSLQPAQMRASTTAADFKLPDDYYKKYEENGYAVSQGKRLFRWYNCSNCHAAGGGNIGPALMDDQWLYGGQPNEVFATIKQGRPNGMPSFAGHISDDQLWQIVAYVRSMSGQLRADVAPDRDDSLSPYKPETRRKKETIKLAPQKDSAS
jgi:cytochrome c oxidase cbb3-type subunit III